MLAAGTQLGPYRVLALLGTGGMGEVYCAHDPRLGRDVAIKVLPDAFAGDHERLARFEREARFLASASHANFAAIHGPEQDAGRRYLVLEFIDGETLQARLARGPLPLRDGLDACRQIAAALEVAQETGVVHRDLKPGNVMPTPAGDVKVLDFGLARSGTSADSSSHSDLSASPTLTHGTTAAGVILGTAAYMSPERARGRSEDKRRAGRQADERELPDSLRATGARRHRHAEHRGAAVGLLRGPGNPRRPAPDRLGSDGRDGQPALRDHPHPSRDPAKVEPDRRAGGAMMGPRPERR